MKVISVFTDLINIYCKERTCREVPEAIIFTVPFVPLMPDHNTRNGLIRLLTHLLSDQNNQMFYVWEIFLMSF